MRLPLPIVPQLLGSSAQSHRDCKGDFLAQVEVERKEAMDFQGSSGLHVIGSCVREAREENYSYPQLYSTPRRLQEEIKFDWNSAIQEAKRTQDQQS